MIIQLDVILHFIRTHIEGEDTLVDASTLNETANANQDINTERDEAIIQMVVPASSSGCAIRGAKGGRGGRGGRVANNESESSTLRRSARNTKDSSWTLKY